jgi:uncharacterized protein (DUF58 family)
VTAARATLFFAVALLLAAVAFDASPLYVPGIALLLAYGAARLWVWIASRQAWLAHETGRLTITEGETYPLDVVVNAGSLPLPGGTVGHPLVQSAVAIGRQTPARVRLDVPVSGRGWRRLEPATLTVADPLRLASASVRAVEATRVLALPRIEPVDLRQDEVDGAEETDPVGAGSPRGSSSGKRGIAFEMDGLRSYRPGSPASRIHWPIYARTGELVERRLVGGANPSPVVVLDAERPADAEALDRAVRAAASLCVHLAPAAGCLLLLPGERTPHRIDPGLALWPRAHARLAVVEGGTRPPDRRNLGPEATVFRVTAAADAPRPESGRGGGIAYVVTASSLAGRAPAFTVAGCRGYRIGAAKRRLAPDRRAA